MKALETVYKKANETMEQAIEHLNKELAGIRAGRATTSMVSSLQVDYYGTETDLTQVANITTPDAKTIAIQPWEKTFIPIIEKAIIDANLGFTPDNNGETIRITIPPLSAERRKDIAKQVGKEAEKARISIRSIRKDSNDELKKLKKEISEDDIKQGEQKIQEITNEYIKTVDKKHVAKEEEILTV